MPLHPLIHNITLDNLDCSEFLWKKYQHNFHALPHDIPNIPFEKLLKIHLEVKTSGGLSCRKRFNAWKYLSDLIEFGPPYFHKFRGKLGDPKNHVILISGDLLTLQHLRSLKMTQAEESTSWGCIQFMVSVMGLFHLKMACADAIWWSFIYNKGKTPDPNDLITHISQIRPKETRKIKTKPGFRRMHECVQHVGIVSRLDVWRLAANTRFPGVETLEDFSKLELKWDVLQEMVGEIAV